MSRTKTADQLRADEFRNLWEEQADKIASRVKDQIGKLYIVHVLGLSPETAEAFVQGEGEAYHQVGLKQSGIPEVDTSLFWNEVDKFVPGLHTPDQTAWLIEKGQSLATWIFVLNLCIWLSESDQPNYSDVLDLLRTNAHAYK